MVPSLLVLRGPGYPWQPSEGPEVTDQTEAEEDEEVEAELLQLASTRPVVAAKPASKHQGQQGRRDRGQDAPPGSTASHIQAKRRKGSLEGSPPSQDRNGGSDLLLSFGNAPASGATPASQGALAARPYTFMQPEGLPVVLDRPLRPSPHEASQAEGIRQDNRQRYLGQQDGQQYELEGWDLLDEAMLGDLGMEPTGVNRNSRSCRIGFVFLMYLKP